MELEWNLDLDNFTQSEDIVLFYQQITGGPSVQRKTSLTISKNNSANFQHKIFVTVRIRIIICSEDHMIFGDKY